MTTGLHGAAAPPSRRVLALDIGAKRTGLAISDATGTLARPLGVVAGADPFADVVARVAALRCEDDGLCVVVVGRPCRLDGTPNEQTVRVDAFVSALRRHIDLPVVLQDERLSSVEAESRLALREKDWRRRKARLDAAAAAVILQDYLDSRPS
jgi:putative Holliday junction resolvase